MHSIVLLACISTFKGVDLKDYRLSRQYTAEVDASGRNHQHHHQGELMRNARHGVVENVSDAQGPLVLYVKELLHSNSSDGLSATCDLKGKQMLKSGKHCEHIHGKEECDEKPSCLWQSIGERKCVPKCDQFLSKTMCDSHSQRCDWHQPAHGLCSCEEACRGRTDEQSCKAGSKCIWKILTSNIPTCSVACGTLPKDICTHYGCTYHAHRGCMEEKVAGHENTASGHENVKEELARAKEERANIRANVHA